ncbi:alpha/beta fold hydrolase [Nocardia brevicatena]|uniref:alpha/beta fold hydrolase n=1 Tax=Nocardia brevicatena TaxID=37327 RepID=UPI0012F98B31|nr:alpha/beta fold hydrolase [Nocardia brevicatena]
MDGSSFPDPVAELQNLFESLPDGLRDLIEAVVFGGGLPRADISGMRWMVTELRKYATALDGQSEDAKYILEQENSVGTVGDQARKALSLHRDGAARLGDDARALADQVQAGANEAEKTLCVMLAFGIELAWRIVTVVSAAAAGGPAGPVAAAPVVESMLVEGRGRIAMLRAALLQAFKAVAMRMAARSTELGPLRLAVTLGKAAALPVAVDAGVQGLQVAFGDRAFAVIGPNGENPTGIDLTSIGVAALSGAGGAVGGMIAGRFVPKVFPRIESSRLALGLVHGTAGAVGGLGAAAVVTGWPENFHQVIAPLLNGGFAGAVYAHVGAHPGSGAAAGAVVDGGGAFIPPDLPAAMHSGDTALAARPSVEVSAESKHAWEAAKAAWVAAPEAVVAGGERREVPGAGANGNTAPLRPVAVRSPVTLGSTPHTEAAGRGPVAPASAAGATGRSEALAPVERPQPGESVARPNVTAPRQVEAVGETSAPPKVSMNTPPRPVGDGPERAVASGDHPPSGNAEQTRTGKQNIPAAGLGHEPSPGTHPDTGTGNGPEAAAPGEHPSPGNKERAHAIERNIAADEPGHETPTGARQAEVAGDRSETPGAGEHRSSVSEEHGHSAEQGAPAARHETPADPAADTDNLAGSPPPSARDRAVDLLIDFHASSGDRVPEHLRLSNLPDEVVRAGLSDSDAQKSMIATLEIIRRGTISDAVPGGMVLRVEQVEGVYALAKHPVEMKPGEGKSLMFMATAMQRAVHEGSVLLVTTTDGLAHREVEKYRKLLTDFGIDVFRADQQQGFGPVADGRPAIVVATGETVGHLCNAGHRPPRNVLIDEMDGIIDRGQRLFLRSEGAEQAAPEPTAREVFAAHDFLADALESGGLSHEDFGLAQITEEIGLYPDGTPEVEFWYDGQAALTPEGRAKVEALPGGKQWLEGLGLSRLETAAAAEFTTRNKTHYVMDAGKIVIIDQGEHGLQRNPMTSSESRWSAEPGKASLAQAVEAKEIRAAEARGMSAEQHQIVVRADADSAKRIDAVEIYRKGGRFFDEVTGASGTLADLNPVLEKIYGLEGSHQVDRSQTHRLREGCPDVVANTRAKLDTIADYAHQMWEGGRGRFQEILCHRNDLVDRQVAVLVGKGVPREAIEAVDADRIAGWGADWEAELQKVFDAAGEQGKILVINRQGQRGVDISVSEEVLAKGGMHVWMTEIPEQSYIYEQAKNRTARNGDPGTAQVLMSPQDALIRNAMHLHAVREAVIHYEQAAAAHRADPTPENHNTLLSASHNLGSLTPDLQQRALRHSTADFVGHHAHSTANPALTLAAAETGTYHSRIDPTRPDEQPDELPEQATRLAGLLGIPTPTVTGHLTAPDHHGAADPLRGLLEQTGIPPAAAEALQQHVTATAPATILQHARFADEQALDRLTLLRDRLATELGLPIADIDGAEGLRTLDPALTEARNTLAKTLDYPLTAVTPAIARDILGEAVERHLTTTNTVQPSARDDTAPASVDPVSVDRDIENPMAETPVAEDVVAAASQYLATAALFDLVVQIHRRSPKSCLNNAVTGMRVLCPDNAHRFEKPATTLQGHDLDVVQEVFDAPLEKAASLDQVVESLKARPGGITVLIYKWKDTPARNNANADDRAEYHMVLLVNDSTSVRHPNLVVVDLAVSRDGDTDTDYSPKDLHNRRTLLNKAVGFDEWHHKQRKFLDKIPTHKQHFETIEFDHNGNLTSDPRRGAPAAEALPPSQRAVVPSAMVDEINRVYPDRPRPEADTHNQPNNPRQAELALVGSRPSEHPGDRQDERTQEHGPPGDAASADRNTGYLPSPTSAPLPVQVIQREIDEVTEILRSRVPQAQLGDPKILRGIRLAAEGLFIGRTRNDDADVARADRIRDDAIGLHEFGAVDLRHSGMNVAEDLRHILDNGVLQGADLGEIMAAMIAASWSDLGDGRRSADRPRYDTSTSAELLNARALAHGYAVSTARMLGFAVNGAGFDERTGTQLIALPTAVTEMRQRWEETDDGEFETAMRVARWVAAAGLQTLSESDAVAGWVLSEWRARGNEIPERQALVDHLRDRADFTHPDSGYRVPDGWLLSNRDMRRDHAVKAREIADRLASDPGYAPLDAYRDARSHAVEMREEYSGFRWQLVVGPVADASDPGALAATVAARLPESDPARTREAVIDAVPRLADLVGPYVGNDSVFVVTASQDADGRHRLLAQLDYTRPAAIDPDPGVTVEELRRELSDVDGRIDIGTAEPLPEGQVCHRVRLDLTRQRILVCCSQWGAGGTGMATLNVSLCEGLAQAGHEVIVWAEEVIVQAEDVESDFRPPDVEASLTAAVGSPRLPRLVDRYADDLPQPVDLVIVHDADDGLEAALEAEMRYPAAKLVSVHHLTPMLWERLSDNPEQGRSKVAAGIYMARRAHLVTGLGPVLAMDALSEAVMAGRGSVHELRPGLAMVEQPQVPSPGDPARILLFGRLEDPLKGVKEIAGVVGQLRAQGRDVRLVARGYSGDDAELVELIGDPAAVELKPHTSDLEELQADIRSSTVVVMPSRAEGFGLVATEAIEQGVPVVVPSSSGVGRFLADIPEYRVWAERFNLVEQPLGAKPDDTAWVAALGAILADVPAAWAAARRLQEQLRPFTRVRSAKMLLHAALNVDPHPRPEIWPSRTQVSVESGQVVVRGEGEDYELILAVADAMETDPLVEGAIIRGADVVFAPPREPTFLRPADDDERLFAPPREPTFLRPADDDERLFAPPREPTFLRPADDEEWLFAPPPRTAVQQDDSRERLLRAFVATVFEQGFDATTVDGVCLRAQVSPEIFDDYFLSTYSVFAEAHEEALSNLTQLVIDEVRVVPASDRAARVAAAVDTYVTALAARPATARMLLVEGFTLTPEERAERTVETTEAIATTLATVFDERVVPERGLPALAAAVHGILADWAVTGDTAALPALRRDLADLLRIGTMTPAVNLAATPDVLPPVSRPHREQLQGAPVAPAEPDQREWILTQLIAVAAELGYTEMSPYDVNWSAGVSIENHQELFSDKQAGFEAACVAAIERLRTATRAAMSDTLGGDVRSRLEAAIRAYLTVLAAHPAETRVLHLDLPAFGPLHDRHRAMLAEHLSRAVDEIDDRAGRLLASAVSGVVTNWIVSEESAIFEFRVPGDGESARIEALPEVAPVVTAWAHVLLTDTAGTADAASTAAGARSPVGDEGELGNHQEMSEGDGLQGLIGSRPSEDPSEPRPDEPADARSSAGDDSALGDGLQVPGETGEDTRSTPWTDRSARQGPAGEPIDGTIFVADTLINSPINVPRIRPYQNGDDRWTPPYHEVVDAFVAYIGNDNRPTNRTAAERAAARRRDGCIGRVARVVSALGSDEAREVEEGRKDWRALETAIAAELIKVELTPHTDDPLASIVEAVHHRQNGADTAVIVVDDGTTAHGYVITNVDGTIVVFDTNIEDPDTRVRTLDRWRQSYPHIEEAFVAFLRNDNGTLSALNEPAPDHTDRAHPRHDIEGPPANGHEGTPSDDSRKDDGGKDNGRKDTPSKPVGDTPKPRRRTPWSPTPPWSRKDKSRKGEAHTPHELERTSRTLPRDDATEESPGPAAAPDRHNSEREQVSASPTDKQSAVESDRTDSGPAAASLRANRPLRRLLSGLVASAIGSSIMSAALPLLTLAETGSTTVAGWVTFALTAPTVLFPIAAGVVADRFNLGRTIMVGQAAGFALATTGCVLVLLGAPHLGLALAGLAFVEKTAAIFTDASGKLAVRALAGTKQEDKDKAFGLNEMRKYSASTLGRFLGPALLVVGSFMPFAVNAACHAFGFETVRRLRAHFPPQKRRERERVTLRDGIRALWRNRFLRNATVVTAVANAMWAVFTLRTTALVYEAALPGWAAGAVLGAGAIGGVVGPLLAGRLTGRTDMNIKRLYPGMLASFTGLAVIQALFPNPFVAGAAAFGVSFVGVSSNVGLEVHRAQSVPERILGQTGGIASTISGTGVALGGLAGGYLLSMLGIGGGGWVAATVVGVVSGVGVIEFLWSSRKDRSEDTQRAVELANKANERAKELQRIRVGLHEQIRAKIFNETMLGTAVPPRRRTEALSQAEWENVKWTERIQHNLDQSTLQHELVVLRNILWWLQREADLGELERRYLEMASGIQVSEPVEPTTATPDPGEPLDPEIIEARGPAHGWPVFVVNYSSDEFGRLPHDYMLRMYDVRLISVDVRAQQSDEAAADLRGLADRLGIDHFSIVGRFEGRTFTEDMAELLGDRVHRVAALVPRVPAAEEFLSWYEVLGELDAHTTEQFPNIGVWFPADSGSMRRRLRVHDILPWLSRPGSDVGEPATRTTAVRPDSAQRIRFDEAIVDELYAPPDPLEQSRLPDQYVVVAPGRGVAFNEYGPPSGRPVVLLPDVPGSRLDPRPSDDDLDRLGIRLIVVDLPGTGFSIGPSERTVREVAADILAAFAARGLSTFSVVGRGLGGPVALTMAALAPEPLDRVVVMAGPGHPHPETGLDTTGMTADNAAIFASSDDLDIQRTLFAAELRIEQDPEGYVAELTPQLPPSDQEILNDTFWRRQFVKSLGEAFRRHTGGWAGIVRSTRNPWGIDLADIRVPVLFVHGTDDNVIPATHAQGNLAAIRGASMIVKTGVGHFGMLPATTEALRWINGELEQPRIVDDGILIRPQHSEEDVAAARSHVRQQLEGWPVDAVEAAEVLVAELADNMLAHTDGDGRVHVVVGDDTARIMVHDGADEVFSAGHTDTERLPWWSLRSGFVATHGVIRHGSGEGKTVWFEIRKPNAAGAADKPVR